MQNRSLERSAKKSVSDTEDYINELVSEIEDLEEKNDGIERQLSKASK